MSEWTRPAQRIHCVVEMDKPLTVRRERWTLVQGDKNANVIEAEVFQTAGKPYDLTGCTVTLTFVRPDHLAVPPITAEVKGNVAAATLTDACYRVSGRYNALMQIAKDGADRTILWLVGDVLETENDGMVDTEAVFPTPEEMLVIFQQVEQAKQAANTAASAANKAADKANAAASGAQKWADTEAEAVAISAESQPTVELSTEGGQSLIRFGIPAGKTPAITFRVATGAPGTQVQIKQSGTPEAPVIDLTIPRGDTGAVDGIDYFAGNPSALGTASPGTANGVARGDHVHPLPSASAIGALAAGGTAADASKLGGKTPDQYLGVNRTAADSSKLGGKAPEYYIQPRNLLDNSNFKKPKNQRGETTYSGVAYYIDRWKSFTDGTVVTVGNDGITFTGANIAQIVPVSLMKTGQTYTFAAKQKDGTICVATGTYPMSAAVAQNGVIIKLDGLATQYVAITTAGTYEWAALYEGAYTAENLPPYVPKEDVTELAACQQYFVRMGGSAYTHIGIAYAQNETQLLCSVHLPQPMREGVMPSVVKGGELSMTAKSGTVLKNISAVAMNQVGVGALLLTLTSDGLTKGDVFDVYVPTGSWLDISADL